MDKTFNNNIIDNPSNKSDKSLQKPDNQDLD
jgi:hypothetical protein